jgi:hypothetical protein
MCGTDVERAYPSKQKLDEVAMANIADFSQNDSTTGDDHEQDNELCHSWTGARSGDWCVDSRNPVEGRGCWKCRGWRAGLLPLHGVSLDEGR